MFRADFLPSISLNLCASPPRPKKHFNPNSRQLKATPVVALLLKGPSFRLPLVSFLPTHSFPGAIRCPLPFSRSPGWPDCSRSCLKSFCKLPWPPGSLHPLPGYSAPLAAVCFAGLFLPSSPWDTKLRRTGSLVSIPFPELRYLQDVNISTSHMC